VSNSEPNKLLADRGVNIIDGSSSWSKIHRADETNRNHLWYSQKSSEHIGYSPVRELRPHHMTVWVDG